MKREWNFITMRLKRFSLVSGLALFACGALHCNLSFADQNAEISRLIAEKNQKFAKLEQCMKKTKGFKIAGISAIGLTAAGTAGNVMLHNKNKDLQKQIVSTKDNIVKQEAKLAELEAKIPQAEQEKKKHDKEAEDKKNQDQKELEQKQDKCKKTNAAYDEKTGECVCQKGYKRNTETAICEEDKDVAASETTTNSDAEKQETQDKKDDTKGDEKQSDDKKENSVLRMETRSLTSLTLNQDGTFTNKSEEEVTKTVKTNKAEKTEVTETKPTASTNELDWDALENPTQDYGVSKDAFCLHAKNQNYTFGATVNKEKIKQFAGFGYWCNKLDGIWTVSDSEKSKFCSCTAIKEEKCQKD